MSQKLIESGAATWQEPASYHYSSIGWPFDGSVSSGCVTQMSVLFRMQRGRSSLVSLLSLETFLSRSHCIDDVPHLPAVHGQNDERGTPVEMT